MLATGWEFSDGVMANGLHAASFAEETTRLSRAFNPWSKRRLLNLCPIEPGIEFPGNCMRGLPASSGPRPAIGFVDSLARLLFDSRVLSLN